MLRKVLLVVVSLIVLVIGSAIVLPILFKDDLIVLVEDQANANLNADVKFGDIGLSLLESFPDFTLTVDELSVIGREEFSGVALADIEELKLSLDLMSVINGGTIQVNTIGLVSPKLHVIVLEDGTANYDIAPSSEEEATEESTEETSFSLGLREYYIRNATLIYDDRSGDMYAELKNLTHEGSGDFTQDDFLLRTYTWVDELTFEMEGMNYLNRTELESDFDMNMNLPNMRFEFVENYVRLNALQLGFDGSVAMPDEETGPIDLDLTFNTTETTFKSILSLIPAIYLTDFLDVETAGSFALDGHAKGRMVGEQLPAFGLNLTVSDAMFHYPDLPKAAENIAIDLHVKNPGGSEDNTIVDLNKFHVELANNPVDMSLHMRTPISDPFIDANIKMNLDLESMKDVIPLEEGQSLTGQIESDINLEGNQSALDQERYADFHAGGSLKLSNFDYQDPELPYATLIEQMSLNFSPRYAELTQFDMKVGKSDISMTGRVNNIVEWYVANAPLSGQFNFSSQLLDLNEFMTEEGEEEQEDEEDESYGVFEVPAGYDFVLNTSIQKMIYDNLEIISTRGSVVMRDQKLSLDRLAMQLLDGSLTMSGFYATPNPVQPDFDFNLDVIGWDIPKTYEYVDMAQKMAPIMKYATGKFSSSMKIKGKMDANMDPLYNTLDGGGLLTTRNASIDKPPVLEKAADAIKYDGLKSFDIDDSEYEFRFENGRVVIEPSDFVIGKEIPSVIGGSHGFDQSLDYMLNLDVPSELLGGAANKAIGGLLSQVNSTAGTNASMPERVDVDLKIEGTSTDPKITPSIGGATAGSITDDLKDRAKDELNKKKDELENQAKEELDNAKADAEKKAREEADKAKQKAKNEADKAKNKAEEEAKRRTDEAKRKAEAEKKRLEEEAKKKAAEEAKKKLKGLFK